MPSARIVANAKSVPVLMSKQFWSCPVYTHAGSFGKYNEADGITG